MGQHWNRILIALVAGTLALAGCAHPTGTNYQPGTGAIGMQLQAPERELQQSLAGSGTMINKSGSDLRIILPQGATVRTRSSVPPSVPRYGRCPIASALS